ncbi:MAG: hypothetical protein LRY71_16955 [Bacillaceae bacterium]|nr:hypothetical protein [Bacillaceae bacterium]
MSVELSYFLQDDIDETNDFKEVHRCAEKLLSFLIQESTLEKINEANQPGASSAKVQEVLLEQARKLGFSSEKTGLFSRNKWPKARLF